MSGSGNFVQRLLNVTLTAASGNPPPVNLTGHRVSARIDKAGLVRETMQLDIYGMSFSLMNSFSTLGMQVSLVPRNEVKLLAGDTDNTPQLVYDGIIYNAYADFSAAPQTAFRISSQAVLADAVDKADATSYPNSFDVASAMASFASKMGLAFENNGVNQQHPISYFYGSVYAQMEACARASGIGFIVDTQKKTLAIWPKNGSRSTSGSTITIGPESGLKGYPTYTANGVQFECLFNPSLAIGQLVKLESSLTPAAKTWVIYKLAYALDSNIPHGKWFCICGGYDPSFAVPLIQ